MREETSGQRLSWLRPRFSIRSLLLATTIIAALFPIVWFAWFLLLHASTGWAAVAFWLTGGILALAALIAFNRRGATRSFWTGFALVGLAYFVLVPVNLGGLADDVMYDHEQLLTSRLSYSIYENYVVPRFVVGGSIPAGTNMPGIPDFINVAHLLWTLLFALCGGLVSLLIWATGRSEASPRRDHE